MTTIKVSFSHESSGVIFFSFVFYVEECDSEGNNEFLVKFTSFPQVSEGISLTSFLQLRLVYFGRLELFAPSVIKIFLMNCFLLNILTRFYKKYSWVFDPVVNASHLLTYDS